VTFPTIFEPSSIPGFTTDGTERQAKPSFKLIQFARGHTRTRRKCTGAPVVVNVTRVLTPAQAATFLTFYESTLKVGSERFVAYISRNIGEDWLYWDASWISEPQWEAVAGQPMWRLSGQLLLVGDAQTSRPDTPAISIEFETDVVGTGDLDTSVVLAVEFETSLSSVSPLTVEFETDITNIQDGATPSSADFARRWIVQGANYGVLSIEVGSDVDTNAARYTWEGA
jgi:hypothetical protein